MVGEAPAGVLLVLLPLTTAANLREHKGRHLCIIRWASFCIVSIFIAVVIRSSSYSHRLAFHVKPAPGPYCVP